MKTVRLFLLILSTFAVLHGKEYPVIIIPISGEITLPEQEVSGLAWYGDDLILLPQYPTGYLYSIQKDWITGFIMVEPGRTIVPRKIPFITPDYTRIIPGFEGYEAIVFDGDNVYMTIEAKRDSIMSGYLVRGIVESGNKIELTTAEPTQIIPVVNIYNMGFESMLLYNNQALVFFEAFGSAVNPTPIANVFNKHFEFLGVVSFPAIEYRITDVTQPDMNGRFWAINYFWPGDKKQLHPQNDSLIEKYGRGASHTESEAIERLVEFRITAKEIQFTERPPLQLELISPDSSRNWEGIVRLDDLGFVLVTDEHPETILAFIPFQNK